MRTTTIAKITAKIHSTSWLEGLPASLTSFLAVAQPQLALHHAVKRHSKAWPAGYALAQSVPPFTMLVASDVSRRSYGLVPWV